MPGEEEIGIQYLEVFDIENESQTIIDTENGKIKISAQIQVI